MLALLQMQMSQVPGWLQVSVAVLAGLQSVAIIAGIVAAYYRFVREKPLASRLQPTISGVAARAGGIIFLQINVSAENVGQVAVPIYRSATGLRLSSRRTGDEGWTFREVRGVFGQQERVEPGATAIDRVWHETMDEGEVAFRLELSVFEDEDSGWLAVEVVNMVAEEDNVTAEGEGR